MRTSLAAVYTGIPGQMELREIPLPRLACGETLVKVLGCTLCGSDLHSFEGRRTVPTPTILGHEIVGEIMEFGDQTEQKDLSGQALRIGDRVSWAIVANCGHCQMCRCGLPQKCLKAVKYGHEAFRPGQELLGGFAEYCLLVAGTSLVRLPESLPLEVACPASCATATIMAAVESAGEIAGKRICVFGAGMLGVTACSVLKASDAAVVTCVDPVESRLAIAKRFGASQIATPQQLEALTQVDRQDLGFDIILELSGSNQAFEIGWPLLRIGGTLILVGSVFPGEPAALPLEQIVRRHLTIRGVHNYAPRHLHLAIEFLSRHHKQFPFADLVPLWLPLKEISLAFAASKQGEQVRVGIRPH